MTKYTPDQILGIVLQSPGRVKAPNPVNMKGVEEVVTVFGKRHSTCMIRDTGGWLLQAQCELKALGFQQYMIADICRNWEEVLEKQFEKAISATAHPATGLPLGSRTRLQFNVKAYAGMKVAVINGSSIIDLLIHEVADDFKRALVQSNSLAPYFLDPSFSPIS